MNNNLAHADSLPVDMPNNIPMNKTKRQGKTSKGSNQDRFRIRKNADVETSRLTEIDRKLGLISTDETGQLERTLNNSQLTLQKTAVPLSVTTRAVGTTTTIYSRAVTTWNIAAIEEIATIYQVFRIHLWLTFYKIYLAQQVQAEVLSALSVFMPLELPDEIRESLHSIAELPSIFVLVLDSIGKIETQEAVYHMGIPFPPTDIADVAEYRSLVILPQNLRTLMAMVSQPLDPVIRDDLLAHWCIPGSRFEDGILMNADQIYPDNYG